MMRLDSEGFLDTPGWHLPNQSVQAADGTGRGQHVCISTWISMSAANFETGKAGGSNRYLWALGRNGSDVAYLRMDNGFGGAATTPYHLRYVSSGWDTKDTDWVLDVPLNDSKYLRGGAGWYHIVMYAGNDPAEPIHMSINGVSASYLAASSTLPAGTLSDITTNGSVGTYLANSSGFPMAGTYFSASAFGEMATYYPATGFTADNWSIFVNKLYSTASYGRAALRLARAKLQPLPPIPLLALRVLSTSPPPMHRPIYEVGGSLETDPEIPFKLLQIMAPPDNLYLIPNRPRLPALPSLQLQRLGCAMWRGAMFKPPPSKP